MIKTLIAALLLAVSFVWGYGYGYDAGRVEF